MGELEDKALQDNLKAFEEQLPKLLVDSEGKWAIGKKGDEFTCWDTYLDAIQYGYKTYGLNRFVVKRVLRPEFDRPIFIGYAA